MTRLLIARIVLLVIAVVVWGYGYRTNEANVRLVAIGLLAIAFVIRFAPPRWFGE